MIQGIIIVLITGFFAGALAERVRLPRLVGMLLAGILIGPYVLDLLPSSLLETGGDIRLIALSIILLKAGLGLDRKKLRKEGTVALRLSFLPCTLEATAVALLTRYFLGWDWTIAFLLGWILCAESPAVLVPLMLKFKGEGWGVRKGIPDLILASGALSDVVAITVFGMVLKIASGGSDSAVGMEIWTLPVQILAGLGAGWLCGLSITRLLTRSRLTEAPIQDFLVAFAAGAALVILGERFHFSGYLAAMVSGVVILGANPVLARRIRLEVDRAWLVAEIFLFVLIGAVVNIGLLPQSGLIGLAILAGGFILGRTPGVFLSTLFSSLNLRERIFMSASYLPKATVQAAIGAIPLSLGIPHGEIILALAVLSILLTAPLGSVGATVLAPRLLSKGTIDPTMLSVKESYTFLVALDREGSSEKAMREAARIARQVDARLIILHVDETSEGKAPNGDIFETQCKKIGDLEHEFVVSGGNPAETILEAAQIHHVQYIFMGKSSQRGLAAFRVGDVARQVMEQSPVPVILVEGEESVS